MTTLNDFINPKKNENIEIKETEVKIIKSNENKKENNISAHSNADLYVKNHSKKEQDIVLKKVYSYDFMPWTKKYIPKLETEFIGNKKAFDSISKFVENHKKEKKKAIILWGASGVGKTCISEILAKKFNLELIELNASDKRNKEVMEDQLGNILKQKSLFGLKKLVLIDDLDGSSGQKDRGGVGSIAKLIPESIYPILITCENPYDDKLKPVRSKCTLIEFKKLTDKEISLKIKQILTLENIEFTDKEVDIISENSKGDLRAGINDTQMLTIGKNKLDIKILNEMEKRIKSVEMKEAIKLVLKSTDAKEVLTAFDRIQEGDLNKALLWLDYNMPLEYVNKMDRAKAYGCLTKADVFYSRIIKRQHWRFLVYVNCLLTAGVSLAKMQTYDSDIEYKDSSRILILWQANMKFAKRKAISEKIARKVHTSIKRVIQDFEIYANIILKSKSKEELIDTFNLDKEELEYLQKFVYS